MIESYLSILPQLWHSKALQIMSDFSYIFRVTKCGIATKIILGKNEINQQNEFLSGAKIMNEVTQLCILSKGLVQVFDSVSECLHYSNCTKGICPSIYSTVCISHRNAVMLSHKCRKKRINKQQFCDVPIYVISWCGVLSM